MEKDNETNVDRWAGDRIASLAPPVGWRADAGAARERLRRAGVARQRLAWWIGASVATALCALAFPGTRVFAKRCVDVCLAETGVMGQRIHKTPSLAPDFTLVDAPGNTVTLSSYRGRVVLVNFWATWCPPCNAEIPWFAELQARDRASGLVVLGVSMDDDGWKAVRPWLSARTIDYSMVVGNRQLAESFGGVESLPTTFLIAKDGRIAKAYSGLVDQKVCEADVQKLLAENKGSF